MPNHDLHVTTSGEEAGGELLHVNGKMCLKLEHVDGGLLSVDFLSGRFLHRIKTSGYKSDLAKACSIKPHQTNRVLDLTAGLGIDAVSLACLGADLTLLEREAAVFSILQDGIQRAATYSFDDSVEQGNDLLQIKRVVDAVNQRIKLLPQQDSFKYLLQCKPGEFDCIYFDPMFPERIKTAKVKIAMQVFHKVVGFDFEQDERILNLAREKAGKRVVVKRSKQAEFIGGVKPSYSIKLKALRYDIYLSLNQLSVRDTE